MGAQFTFHPLADEILNRDAVAFLTMLHRRFDDRRLELVRARSLHDVGERQIRPVSGDRRDEITGPVDTKTMIEALNSGASAFVADFGDPSCSNWLKILSGQRNVRDTHLRTLRMETCVKSLELDDEVATLIVRPRDWHRTEHDFSIDRQDMSASLFDFGLALFHSARAALDAGSAPRFRLPAVETQSEAELWADVLVAAQDYLGLPPGTVKATVTIGTDAVLRSLDSLHDGVAADSHLAEAV